MTKALWFLTLVLVLYIGGVLGGAATTTTTSEAASGGHATESPSEAPYVYPTDSMEPANGICPGLGLFQLTSMRQFKKNWLQSKHLMLMDRLDEIKAHIFTCVFKWD